MIRFNRDARWRRFEQALRSDRWQRLARRNIQVALERVALFIMTAVRRAITAGNFTANAALTLAIKAPGTKPLVDDTAEGIFNAVTKTTVAWNKVFVGVKFQERNYNLAILLHYGTKDAGHPDAVSVIPVTPAMRTMFWYLWLASIGRPVNLTGRAAELWERMPGGWLPLNDSTTHIVVPPRPFLDEVFDMPSVEKFFRLEVRRGIAKTFKEMTR